MDLKTLEKFLKERPLVTARGLSEEADLSPTVIGKVLNGSISLTERIEKQITPIMEKYGYLPT